MTEFGLVIRNARVATAADVFECDIGVIEGKIVALSRGEIVWSRPQPHGVMGRGRFLRCERPTPARPKRWRDSLMTESL